MRTPWITRGLSHAVCGTLIAAVVAAPLPLALSSRPARAQEASPVSPSSLGDGHVTCRAPGTGNEVRVAIGSRRLLGRVAASDSGVIALETLDGPTSVPISDVDSIWVKHLAPRRAMAFGAATVATGMTVVAISESDDLGLASSGLMVASGAAIGAMLGGIFGSLIEPRDHYWLACGSARPRGDAVSIAPRVPPPAGIPGPARER